MIHAHRSVPPARAGDVIGRSSDSGLNRGFYVFPEISSDMCKTADPLQLRVQSRFFTSFPYSRPIKDDQ